MANDTAALVVALSAQLTKFEKDMQGAVSIADKRTKEIETRFGAMNSAITDKLGQLGSAATSNLGIAGTLLNTLGPAGVIAAVALGTVVGGMYALASATAEYATKAKALKEASETIGLTITQFKLLGQAGGRVGLDFDETTGFFTKFIANMEALRNGGGPLYDALLKIDVGLLRQLSATKDSAEAIDILINAYKRLDDQSARLNLSRAAGGKAGITGVRLLDSLANQGGLTGLERASPGIDEEQIKRAAQLKVEIESIANKTANIWGGMFSDAILSNQKAAVQNLNDISVAIEKIVKGKNSADQARSVGGSYDALGNFNAGIDYTVQPAPGTSFEGRFKGDGSSKGIQPYVAPKAADKAPATPPSVDLAILQKNIALLGEAVTQGEQWKLKRLEIAAAAEKGGLMDGVASRALEAFRVTMITAANAARERLGIATQDQIVEARLAQLSQDKAKFGLTENEVQKATVIIMREAKDAADALTVRQAYLPGLKQLEIDAQNTRKSLDTLAVNSLSNLETGLVDFATGTKTASEAFKSMANSIISDLLRMQIRASVTGPLSGLLQSGLSNPLGGGGGGNIPGASSNYAGFNVTGLPGNAAGTDNWGGGPTWVGEDGPEVVNLPRGSQVVPNNVASKMGGSQVNVSVNNFGGEKVDVGQPKQNNNGGVDIEVTIGDLVAKQMGKPGSTVSRTMDQRKTLASR
jgi:hypothetical protein